MTTRMAEYTEHPIYRHWLNLIVIKARIINNYYLLSNYVLDMGLAACYERPHKGDYLSIRSNTEDS